MNKQTDPRAAAAHEEWELRLQDWLDGTADEAEAAAVEQHMAGCSICTQLSADLRHIDAQLAETLPAEPGPGSQFDAQVFARIAEEEAARERVRKSAQKASIEQELAQLQRAWRSTLVRVLGGIALVVVALAWLIASGTVPFLSATSITVALASVTPVQWLVVGLIGVAASFGLTRWAQSTM